MVLGDLKGFVNTCLCLRVTKLHLLVVTVLVVGTCVAVTSGDIWWGRPAL